MRITDPADVRSPRHPLRGKCPRQEVTIFNKLIPIHTLDRFHHYSKVVTIAEIKTIPQSKMVTSTPS